MSLMMRAGWRSPRLDTSHQVSPGEVACSRVRECAHARRTERHIICLCCWVVRDASQVWPEPAASQIQIWSRCGVLAHPRRGRGYGDTSRARPQLFKSSHEIVHGRPRLSTAGVGCRRIAGTGREKGVVGGWQSKYRRSGR